MSLQDTFNGAKSGFTFMRAFSDIVAQEIGVEKALALSAKTSETLGTLKGMMIKEELDTKEIGIKEVNQLLSDQIESNLGIFSEIVDEDPNKIQCKVGKCPVYESAQELGVDAKDIEAHCRAGSIKFMDAMAKQLNPNLSYQLTKFRSSSDDCCVETIVLS
jgi:hypothetical protein